MKERLRIQGLRKRWILNSVGPVILILVLAAILASATVANSWDPELGEAVGAAMGEEAAAQGVSVLLGPGLNIKRSPLCGRNFEYFSEDPYLSGEMGAALVKGIQSNGVGSCIKHFAANNQETDRMVSDSVMDERTLHEIYLPAFETVVKKAQPLGVMAAYNKLNGTHCSENKELSLIHI